MRILHIYKDYAPVRGGIENYIETLAEGQAAAGHDVTVLVTDPGAPLPSATRVRVLRLPRIATVASTPLTLHFPRAIRRQQPEITHLHVPYPLGEIGHWLGGRGRPYVVTYHADVVRQRTMLVLYAPLLRRILRGASRIIATSENYIRTSPFLHPLAAACTVIPLWTDPLRFVGAAPLLPRDRVPTILFVGRHRHYKGVDDLIRALDGMDARLLVAGDGPMRPRWERLAGSLGLGGKVRFLGEVSDDDLPGLYASADVFALPSNSRAEAFGAVLLEAMAAGLPCVTTELGTGTSFVVQDGSTGLVVPRRDPAAIRSALRTLVDNPDLRRRMGCSGQARVRQEFAPESLRPRVEEVYREALGSHGRG